MTWPPVYGAGGDECANPRSGRPVRHAPHINHVYRVAVGSGCRVRGVARRSARRRRRRASGAPGTRLAQRRWQVAEVDGEDQRVIGWNLAEAEVAVEPDRPLVPARDKQVQAARALVTEAGYKCRDQAPADPAPLQTREKVDVQVRGEPARQPGPA